MPSGLAPIIPVTLKKDDSPEDLPQHLAIIMDGNGRWAKARGRARVQGHRRGAMKDVMKTFALIWPLFPPVDADPSNLRLQAIRARQHALRPPIARARALARSRATNAVRVDVHGRGGRRASQRALVR